MDLAQAAFALKSHTVRRRVGALHAELLANQRLPRQQLDELTAERSAAIATFAARETGFYRDLYAEHGLSPRDLADLRDPAVWARLPVVNRTVVKQNTGRMTTSEASPRTTRPALTGGSTGEPLKVLHDARVPTLPLAWRMYGWWGVEPWDNLARFARWGFGRADAVKRAAAWWPSRQVYADASKIEADTLRALHDQMVATRPALLEGYVGALVEFADHVDAHGLQVPWLRAVATTAAPLTEEVRTRLEQVFRVPVYDEYRGSELGWMAGECSQQQGLHVFSDMRRIEVLDADDQPVPPGVVGDIVVTDLTNRVQPLIRYRLGDRGALTADLCPCGVTLPVMAKPEGRTTDVLRLPSGAALNHRLMAMFSQHSSSVKLFQIHQQADYSIVVRVVADETVPDARTHIEEAVQTLRQRVAGEAPVRLEYVGSLPYTRGKIKYVISDVAPADAS
ncbi:phenylacetate--CoA ligase family protein [Auraticoccus monumenti]|uniref:Phenylacetate-CoA ligase n=1 Tax=Auraticoccus monumenti TaxID=675864 RepID=A0A1G6VXD1_9ACTN|nr:phenylacetate--CoA ligase family protein [Auraticoccus monumenti]SDD57465.1 phenylacetate-CoA ligase [Auraticoccus monumenti]